MKQYKKDIIKLTANEVLNAIFDLAIPFFESDRKYRISAKKYREERSIEHSNFSERLSYLKRHGLVETFVEGKDQYYELTPKAINKILKSKDFLFTEWTSTDHFPKEDKRRERP